MFNRYSINPHEAVRKAAQQVDAYLADRRASGGICPGTVQRRLTAREHAKSHHLDDGHIPPPPPPQSFQSNAVMLTR
jgi:hypothetical protein